VPPALTVGISHDQLLRLFLDAVLVPERLFERSDFGEEEDARTAMTGEPGRS
jgi:hypothetical protein